MSGEEFSNVEDHEAFRSDDPLSPSLIHTINCLRLNKPNFKELCLDMKDASALLSKGWEQLGMLTRKNKYLDSITVVLSPLRATDSDLKLFFKGAAKNTKIKELRFSDDVNQHEQKNRNRAYSLFFGNLPHITKLYLNGREITTEITMSRDDIFDGGDREAFCSCKELPPSIVDAIKRLKRNEPHFRHLDLDIDKESALSSKGRERLGILIGKNDYLESIKMTSYRSKKDDLEVFFDGAAKNTNIKDLIFSSYGLEGKKKNDAIVLISLLHNSPNLAKLCINRKNISTEDFNLLVKALQTCPIKDLDLSNCRIKDISPLERHKLPNLTKLDLSRTHIDVEGCKVISKLLQSKEIKLEVLSLRKSNIEVNGAEILAHALTTNATLTTLDLQSNALGDDGAIMITNALLKNATLTNLNLNGNNIGQRGYAAVIDLVCGKSSTESVWKPNNTLTDFDLDHNQITATQEKYLMSALGINKEYKQAADLKTSRHSHLTTDELKEFFWSKKLDLQNQQLIHAVAEKEKENIKLKAALANSVPIDTIDLTGNVNAKKSATGNNRPSKRQRNGEATPKSSLALAHEHNQNMVRVKEEVTEWAITAERRATEAEQKKDELELELECPICRDLDKQSCGLIPCGHVVCNDCSLACAMQRCPTCRTHVEGRLNLFK